MQKTTKYARREYINYKCSQGEVKDALVKWLKNLVAVPDGGIWDVDWICNEDGELSVTLQQRFETPEERDPICISEGGQNVL